MTSERPQPPDGRQRKLDDLFGDDPFLSPTMKARRLYESGDAPAAPGRPDVALSYLLPTVSEEEASALWRQRAGVAPGFTVDASTSGSVRPGSKDVAPGFTGDAGDACGPPRGGSPPRPRRSKVAKSQAQSGAGRGDGRLRIVETQPSRPDRRSNAAADWLDPAGAPWPGRLPGPIPLTRVAAILRGEAPATRSPAEAETLRRLGTEVLRGWLEVVPKPDTLGADEE
jgi:hypothetical protein